MIDVKSEIQYILVIRLLADMAKVGFLTNEELAIDCLGIVLDIPAHVW